MRRFLLILTTVISILSFSTHAFAQTTRPAGSPKDYSNSLVVTRMMRFDLRKDGKLTRDEVTDGRLKRLFDEADTNKDGIVTREELIAIAAKLDSEVGDDSDGLADDRRMGQRGPGGFGGPPTPGQILPPRMQNMLNLTDQQKQQLTTLQKEVDQRLANILTVDQQQQLKSMARRGPGGPPGDGGPPDGPPPARPSPHDRPRGPKCPRNRPRRPIIFTLSSPRRANPHRAFDFVTSPPGPAIIRL